MGVRLLIDRSFPSDFSKLTLLPGKIQLPGKETGAREFLKNSKFKKPWTPQLPGGILGTYISLDGPNQIH